jgi:hypothetical protein
MQRFYHLSFGLSLRSLLVPLVLIGTLSLAGCSGNPLSLLTGSGTNVAANTQIGKENTQNLGLNLSKRPQLRVDAPVQDLVQDNSTTSNTTLDPLLIILLILGWLAPSPSEIARYIRDLFKTV